MTRSKVIGGQIVIVISVNLFQIAPVRTGSLQLQPNLVHRCTMGTYYDALRGHMTRSKVIGGQIIVILVNLFQILFEQVRFNYNQTWIICRYNKGAQWEPSHYDAFRGHMTRSKVIGGQIVIVISINLFQIAPVRTGSLQLQPNLVQRCTMGTFSLWRSSRSHDKVKGHWRSNCYSYFS